MKNLSNVISKLITMVVVLIVGILCIVVNAADGETAVDAYKSISIVIGVVFIAISSIAIVLEAIVKKSLLSDSSTISAGVLLAAGIFCVSDKNVAGSLLSNLVNYVPYVLVVLGCLFIVDAILVLVYSAVKHKDYSLPALLIEIAVGAVALLFGVLAFAVDGIKNNKFMILGIIMIVYAIFGSLAQVLTLVSAKKATVVVVETAVEEAPKEEASEEVKEETKEEANEEAPKTEE